MKLFITTLALIISFSAFAGAPTPVACDDEISLYNEVAGLVYDKTALEEMNLKSMAEITFVIGDDNVIHVKQVITKDYLLEFYIRQKLEGIQVNHCFEKDHAYTMLVNAKLV